jgi:hypothetical protein
MNKIRKNTRVLIARTFDLITFRLGAFLLWLTCIFVPLGQHRLWLRARGWWIYPLTASLAFLSVQLAGTEIHAHLWARLLCLPFGFVYAFDLWLIAFAALPKSKGGKV